MAFLSYWLVPRNQLLSLLCHMECNNSQKASDVNSLLNAHNVGLLRFVIHKRVLLF